MIIKNNNTISDNEITDYLNMINKLYKKERLFILIGIAPKDLETTNNNEYELTEKNIIERIGTARAHHLLKTMKQLENKNVLKITYKETKQKKIIEKIEINYFKEWKPRQNKINRDSKKQLSEKELKEII